MADPTYDNPSFNIFYPQNYSQSASLTLTILLQSWPINSYPYAILLPSSSALIVAGEAVFLTCLYGSNMPAVLFAVLVWCVLLFLYSTYGVVKNRSLWHMESCPRLEISRFRPLLFAYPAHFLHLLAQ